MACDECVAAALVHQLRAAGHDASYMADGGPGTIDAAVLQLAHEEGRPLRTEDKDFGDLVFRGRYVVIEEKRFRSRPLLRSLSQ